MKALDRNDLGRLAAALDRARRITLVTHTHPDGDAVGSTVALLSYLTGKVGKEDVQIIYPDPVTAHLRFLCDGLPCLAASEQTDAARERIASSDLIVCLDCSGFSRVEGLADDLLGAKAKKILIDHHLNPKREAFDLVFSETEISSCCELLYHILLEQPAVGGDPCSLPPLTGRGLMAGMTTDTNNFSNSVWPTTFAMASGLLDAGVNRDELLERLFFSYSPNRLLLQGYLLDKCLTLTPKGAAWIIMDRSTRERIPVGDGDTEGFVNLPLTAASVRLSIFLKEEEDRWRVSIRSKRGVSANVFARRYFDGGGHEQAAGGRFLPSECPDASLEDFLGRITDEFLS